MEEKYDQILNLVAENPGTTLEEITDLAADPSVTDTEIPNLLSEAVSNDDLVEFNGRYWVMRTGKYQFDRYAHPET